MSKIGKKHIPVPSDVKVQINGNKINLEGPKGKKSLDINIELLNIPFGMPNSKKNHTLVFGY